MRNGSPVRDHGFAWIVMVSLLGMADGTLPAADAPTKSPVIPVSVQQAEAELKSLRDREEVSSQEIVDTVRKLDLLKQQIDQSGPEIDALKKSQADLQTQLKADQASAEKAEAARKKTDDAATTKSAAQATEKLKKSQQLYSEAEKKTQQAVTALNAAQNEVSALEKKLIAARETYERSHALWSEQEQKVRRLLKEAGLWVSFRKEIASILHARCLACHSAKRAEGGLNLATYAELMMGGESGVVIAQDDRDSSLLLSVLEDGSMPKNAEPLTAAELASVKKWVRAGARLDEDADPNTPLIELMPRTRQPNAPANYRTPVPITALAFSPDGKMLASSGYHEVLIWAVETQSLQKRISDVAERVYDIQYSPDGRQLAVAAGTPGELGEAKLFDIQTGKLTADLQRSADVILGVSFSPDGKQLATCGSDGTLRVFDLKSNEATLQIAAHADWINDVNWSADGKRLVSGGRDKTVKVFDAQSGESVLSFSGHTDVVTAVAFLPGDHQLVTSGADRVVRIVNASDASEVRKITGFSGEITQLHVLADGRVVTTSIDRKLRIHGTADGKNVLTFEGASNDLLSLAVHVATGQVASGTLGGEIRIAKLADGKLICKWIAVPSSTVSKK
jgi:WD40 repeat protein